MLFEHDLLVSVRVCGGGGGIVYSLQRCYKSRTPIEKQLMCLYGDVHVPNCQL